MLVVAFQCLAATLFCKQVDDFLVADSGPVMVVFAAVQHGFIEMGRFLIFVTVDAQPCDSAIGNNVQSQVLPRNVALDGKKIVIISAQSGDVQN